MNKNLLILFTIAMVFVGCEELLSPADENRQSLNNIYNYPYYAEGVLMNAYSLLPTNSFSFNEVATDDAVSNDKTNGYLRMATGQWSAINNPMDQWTNSYTAIAYINLFLSNVDSVTWSSNNKDVNRLYKDRLKGEAYGLRAIFMLYLLHAHAGYNANGELLGVPIIKEVLQQGSDFNKPRNTFDECISQIYSDIEQAENYLPFDYVDIKATTPVPSKYSGINFADYNTVFGSYNMQRISMRIIRGIKAKTALLAASPAYNPDNNIKKWEDAANYAATVLDSIKGIAGMDSKGAVFYLKASVDILNLSSNRDQKEMLWRGSTYTGYDMETNIFPPSLFGNGRINPTQNLVDAFPMANGYPITDAGSGYVSTNPYANRDPRLKNYIVYNGSTMSNTTINTNKGKDGVDSISTSTRTGYYLKKLMREDVNLNPNTLTGQKHYPVRIRYTEIFLIYAEAANEAWGPDGTGGTHSYSARQVIAAIRSRAGISKTEKYLPSITTKEEMRDLIHNERRLELCFEGFRFWDLRRWKEDITQPAKGIKFTENGYEVVTVENRLYQDYMFFGPIPYNEVLRANLIQNKGW